MEKNYKRYHFGRWFEYHLSIRFHAKRHLVIFPRCNDCKRIVWPWHRFPWPRRIIFRRDHGKPVLIGPYGHTRCYWRRQKKEM